MPANRTPTLISTGDVFRLLRQYKAQNPQNVHYLDGRGQIRIAGMASWGGDSVLRTAVSAWTVSCFPALNCEINRIYLGAMQCLQLRSYRERRYNWIRRRIIAIIQPLTTKQFEQRYADPFSLPA